MTKLVSNVFKIIIIAVLLGMAFTLTTCVIDVFTTIDRMDSVARYASYDIAKNNSLSYSTYKYMAQELYNISKKSRYMRTHPFAALPKYTAFSHDTSGYVGIALHGTTGNNRDTRYIQLAKTSQGILKASKPSLTVNNTKNYWVANYGDILELNINAQIRPTMWAIDDNVADSGWLAWTHIELTLKYTIPALEYVKG